MVDVYLEDALEKILEKFVELHEDEDLPRLTGHDSAQNVRAILYKEMRGIIGEWENRLKEYKRSDWNWVLQEGVVDVPCILDISGVEEKLWQTRFREAWTRMRAAHHSLYWLSERLPELQTIDNRAVEDGVLE